MKRNWTNVITYGFLAMLGVIVLIPILWNLLTSIKEPVEAFVLPPKLIFRPTLESYITLFLDPKNLLSIDIPLYARNSIIVASATTILSVTFGLLSGFSLARFRVRGQAFIAAFIVATRMLPPIATVIPLFLLGMRLGILDTLTFLVLAYTALNIPFATWLLRSFFTQIPYEIEEAAMIDGCSRMQSLVRVILPLMGPGVATASIFAFLLAWNDLAIALVLTSQAARTLPLAVLSFQGEEGVMWGPMSAAATTLMVPGILFIIVAQRYMVRGLTAGSLKG